MKKFFILMLAITLSACGNTVRTENNGYQFGDITRAALSKAKEVLTLRIEYCATEDPIIRQAAIELIREIEPGYPEHGICTTLSQAIAEMEARQVNP